MSAEEAPKFLIGFQKSDKNFVCIYDTHYKWMKLFYKGIGFWPDQNKILCNFYNVIQLIILLIALNGQVNRISLQFIH